MKRLVARSVQLSLKQSGVFWTAFSLIVITLLSSLARMPSLQTGTWRATLKTESGAELPFNFTLTGSPGKLKLDIINGDERFRVNDIGMKGDSVIINMPLFDSEIRAVNIGKVLRGNWVKHLATRDVMMPFYAEPGKDWRFFETVKKPERSVSGRWAVKFSDLAGKELSISVAELSSKGNKVTGTFLTSTGDYRFLEGTVSDGTLYLSCFDGSHAFLFTGKLNDANTITEGKFYSGLSYIENWTAVKDENAKLPDAFSLTYLKPAYKKIDFSFQNLEGKKVSLSDEKFKNKVVIVQFMGSWCPNCMDETAYLVPFYKKYRSRGVEIIGLAYERFTDIPRAKKNVMQLKNYFNINYELLLTGVPNDKKQVAASIPALNDFLAFPTTIILNKKGEVSKIHTGFSGPGTGNHYTEFITEFDRHINSLLAEK